ncbi:MAG: GMC family oxidoreductase [Deferribacterales bacterium]
MAKILNKTDVVTVGVGFTGGVIAAECTRAGLNVVGLERGGYRTVDDFMEIHDEWRYAINYGLMQDLSKETITFQNNRGMRALPMRQLGSFLLGDGLGGAGVHWNAMNIRFFPYDFEIKTKTKERYGNKLSNDYLLQDWGLTYNEIEPYYTKFEYAIGTSGEMKSPFDGKRSKPYPMKPLVKTKILSKFEKAAQQLGCHPYMTPASICSDAYTTPYGEELNECQYCGYCERFGCEYDAKSSPINTLIPVAQKTGKYDLRCNANVVEVLKKGDKVTGVKYVDALTGEEYIQPADIVVLCSFVMNNAKLLMLSKIGEMYNPETGKGTLGRNFCYQVTPGATGFFDEQMNVFAGAGALGVSFDDYNGDNFDHSKLDFIHGGLITMLNAGSRPIGSNAVPKGTPSWGAEFKKASVYNFTRALGASAQGASMPHKDNFLSLDDTYKDAYGLPLLKMTYNFTKQDRAMFAYLGEKVENLFMAMGAKSVSSKPNGENYNIVPYQSTHITGGTVMGRDPKDSVVNNYMQHWDADNLFVVGAGNFPHNGGCNPTDTVGALAYRCAEGVLKYNKKSASLV